MFVIIYLFYKILAMNIEILKEIKAILSWDHFLCRIISVSSDILPELCRNLSISSLKSAHILFPYAQPFFIMYFKFKKSKMLQGVFSLCISGTGNENELTKAWFIILIIRH